MDYEKLISDRITALRLKKGLSESKLSYELGHSKGYIQSITSGRALPSMSEFLYLCQYFGVRPTEFFAVETDDPQAVCRLADAARNMAPEDLEYLLALADRLNRNR